MAGDCEKSISSMLLSDKNSVRPMAFCTGPMPQINFARSLIKNKYGNLRKKSCIIHHEPFKKYQQRLIHAWTHAVTWVSLESRRSKIQLREDWG